MSDGENDYTEYPVSSKTVYQGALLHVKEDRVRLPNGKPAKREYIEHQGAVLIIALLDENTVLLERQYRYPVRQHCIELPAGKKERGEAPLLTAQRELKEETGYEANDWQQLGSLLPCIGYADEVIEFYVARDLRFIGAAHDDGEFLDVFPLSIDEAIAWIGAGKIKDVKTIAGLFWARHLRE